MNAFALAEAVVWLSQRLPDTPLADFAALLTIGTAGRLVSLPELAAKLGVSEQWVDAFVARHAAYFEGNAPALEIKSTDAGRMAELSSVGRNLLNQFWQRSGMDARQCSAGNAGHRP